MKTKSIIGALAIVSLSFAACEKPDEMLRTHSSLKSIGGQSDNTARVQLLPKEIINRQTGEQTEFAFDNAGKLLRMSGTTVSKVFEYDDIGRLARVAVSDLKSEKANQTVEFKYADIRTSLPHTAVVSSLDPAENGGVIRKIALRFNADGLKISESEINAASDREGKRTLFEYDVNKNCIAVIDMIGSQKVNYTRFDGFDLKPNELSNVGIMQLLPGEFAKRHNAFLISFNASDDKPWVEKHTFNYNANGWPESESVDIGGAKKVIRTISYQVKH